MHLIVILPSGQQLHFEEPWASFAQKHLRQGALYFDGKEAGRLTVINSFQVEQFSDGEWKGIVEKSKAQQEAANRAKAQAAIDCWNAQPWFKRVGRKVPAGVLEAVKLVNAPRGVASVAGSPVAGPSPIVISAAPSPAPELAKKSQEPAK